MFAQRMPFPENDIHGIDIKLEACVKFIMEKSFRGKASSAQSFLWGALFIVMRSVVIVIWCDCRFANEKEQRNGLPLDVG